MAHRSHDPFPLVRPGSLAEFLDHGGDLSGLDGLECLAESVLLYLGEDPLQRAAAAEFERGYAEAWLAGFSYPEPHMLSPGEITQDKVTRFLWFAELAENPALAARFEDALPEEIRQSILAIHDERRRRHRLLVGPSEAGKQCSACEDALIGLAVEVDDSGGITFCAACIGLAAAAMGGSE